MKITGVRAVLLAVPLRPQTPPSAWAAGTAKQLLVRVDTDEGLVGWGESFAYGAPLAVASVIDEALAPLLLGADPLAKDALVLRMQQALMIWGRRGLGMFALSGIELALWDLAGKARGVSVAELLGGPRGRRADGPRGRGADGPVVPDLRAYASLLRYERAADAARAAEGAAAAGYAGIKLHQTDVASVVAARAAVGDAVELMLDVNCPWSVDEAIRIGRELEPCRLAWFEEPVWPPEDYAGLARVRRALAMPIAAGENDATSLGVAALIAADAADIVQPSVTKCGGLGEMCASAALARAAGVLLVPHCFYYGPGRAATLHFAAATPGIPWVEDGWAELEAPLTIAPLRAEAGRLRPPPGPGLGADPPPEVLARYPFGARAATPFYLT